MASLEEIRAERIKKIEQLTSGGKEAYPILSLRQKEIGEVVLNFTKLNKGKKSLVVAGRIMGMRGQGALIFIDLDDGTGRLQALLKKDELDQASFDLFKEVADMGDIVEVKGTLFLTKRDEKTILIKKWSMLTKSLRPLPDKWHGLQDIEERFRRRYLDSLMSAEVKERFVLRSKIISEIRTYLNKENFLEIETPMLQTVAGGATARPFTTHHHALDIDLNLRISPELYLKQMLVGGFPKVYELARNFRNEGIDVTHNPEFTMLEFYESFSNASEGRKLVEKMLRTVIKNATGKLELTFNKQTIDFAETFKTVTYLDLLKRYALLSNPLEMSKNDLSLKANQLGIKNDRADSKEKILDLIYKKVCRPKLVQPTFVIDYPKDYLPLAKKLAVDSPLVDAFQLVIGGVELVKGFSELNDPIDQRLRFEAQEKMREAGDDEAQKLDESFLEALEYGMPPAGGVGIGIDRLMMILTDTANIKEVIFFPTMRPR